MTAPPPLPAEAGARPRGAAAPRAPERRPQGLAPNRREELLREGDRSFEGRAGNPGAVEAALQAWSGAASLSGGADVESRMARAEHFLGQTTGRAAHEPHFSRGAEHALSALRWLGVEDAQGCAVAARAEAGAALYWRAENLEGSAREAGLVAGARDRRLALCLARRAAQIAPDYFHAGPLRLLGKLLATTPVLDGGSLEESRKAFERAIEKSPAFAPTRVEFAQTWAVKSQDRKLFEAALDAAMAQTIDPPEVGPENAMARERARALKLRVGELF